MASDPQRESLPFEPKTASKKDKSSKVSKDEVPKGKASGKGGKRTAAQTSGKVTTKMSRSSRGKQPSPDSIPKVVSNRMIRRMAVFCGIPTFLAMVIFVASYVLLTRHILEFPKVVVLLSTLGCFGLGVLGLSYGVLSASWEEDVEGSLLGTAEFSINFKRMVQSMREAKQNKNQG